MLDQKNNDGKEWGAIKVSTKLILRAIVIFLPLIIIFSIVVNFASQSIYHKFVTPKYTATSRLLVKPKNENTTEVKYISTYSQLAKDSKIVTDIRNSLSPEFDLSQQDILTNLNVITSDNSQVITLNYTSENEKESIVVVNKAVETVVNEIPSILNVNDLSVVSLASDTSKVTSLSLKQYSLITFTISFVIISLIAILFVCYGPYVFFSEQVTDISGAEKIFRVKERL